MLTQQPPWRVFCILSRRIEARACHWPWAQTHIWAPGLLNGATYAIDRSQCASRFLADPTVCYWCDMDAAQESRQNAPGEPPVMDMLTGLHVQACGHYMHFGCCKRYTDSLRQSSLLSAPFEGMNLLCLDAGEFLCPICRRLANTLLPVCTSSVQTPSCPPPPPPELPTDVLSRALAALPLTPAPPPPALLSNDPSRDMCVEDFLARAWVGLTERSVWNTRRGGAVNAAASLPALERQQSAAPIATCVSVDHGGAQRVASRDGVARR